MEGLSKGVEGCRERETQEPSSDTVERVTCTADGVSTVVSTQPSPPGERASGKSSWKRWHRSLERDNEQELSDKGCVVERAFLAEGAAQIKA